MPWPFRRAKTTVDYWGTPVTGPADRFRRHKTTGAREAAREGQQWEDAERAAERQPRRKRWGR